MPVQDDKTGLLPFVESSSLLLSFSSYHSFRQKWYTEPLRKLHNWSSCFHLLPIPPEKGEVVFPKWNSHHAITLLKSFGGFSSPFPANLYSLWHMQPLDHDPASLSLLLCPRPPCDLLPDPLQFLLPESLGLPLYVWVCCILYVDLFCSVFKAQLPLQEPPKDEFRACSLCPYETLHKPIWGLVSRSTETPSGHNVCTFCAWTVLLFKSLFWLSKWVARLSPKFGVDILWAVPWIRGPWVDQNSEAGLLGGHTMVDSGKEVLGYKDVAIILGLSCCWTLCFKWPFNSQPFNRSSTRRKAGHIFHSRRAKSILEITVSRWVQT